MRNTVTKLGLMIHLFIHADAGSLRERLLSEQIFFLGALQQKEENELSKIHVIFKEAK